MFNTAVRSTVYGSYGFSDSADCRFLFSMIPFVQCLTAVNILTALASLLVVAALTGFQHLPLPSLCMSLLVYIRLVCYSYLGLVHAFAEFSVALRLSTETVRTIWEGEPRALTSTFTQLSPEPL